VLLLYGDTNSTLAGAIAGSKMDPAVAHVEAGLRSYNREMPEETNRVLTDHASDILFAPSESAVETLAEEGIADGVHFVGDVMYDAILWAQGIAREESAILDSLSVQADKFILSTVHRAANTDDQNTLESIIGGLSATPLPVVLPLHPRTEKRLEEYGLRGWATDELEVIDPVGYIDFVRLVDDAERVATDSGGVQKEAFYLDTPCVTMREETEWRETTECGWNRLVGSDSAKIREALTADDWPESKHDLYGNGQASQRVIEVLESV
jgi:UDP-N-acetylglucosamine 2-epimerase (non-hydrolysing)